MARIIIFGEILWDCLPDGPRLGGAPLNVACNLSLLGHEAVLVSAVGKDDFGNQALEALSKYGVNTDFVQQSGYPTGTVEVTLDDKGDASYRFTPDCAWHHLGDLMTNRSLPDGEALVYGTLANHTPQNWRWLKSQLAGFTGKKCCDINLRDPWDKEVVKDVGFSADVLKCNESEYEALTGRVAKMSDTSLLSSAREQIPEFPHSLCITFGKEGAFYFSEKNEIYCGAGPEIEVVDSIGAGDAFMAGLVHQLLTQNLLSHDFLNTCCRLGAEAASRSGALPEVD